MKHMPKTVTRAGAITMGAAAMLAVAVVGLAPAASAQAAAAPNCQFGSTYGTVVSSALVTKDIGGNPIGKIQLCRDSSYKYWGFLLLNNPPTASQYGNAYIERYRDGSYESLVGCDSKGGNGIVVPPNQTRCWTPKFSGLSGHYTFDAIGFVNSSHTGNRYAYGQTPRKR
ncbi:MAG: hypothetical protein ACRDSR_26325 [Pseudonocardiaceae bacterium]